METKIARGRGVHVKCYDGMVDIHVRDHPRGVKPPTATPHSCRAHDDLLVVLPRQLP
jgi:hypothetical protein